MGRRDGRRGNRSPGGKTLNQLFLDLFAGQADASLMEAQNVQTSGGNITAWVDALDATHTFSVVGTAIPAPAASARFKGASAITMSGGHHFLSNRAAARFKKAYTNAGVSIISVYAPTSVASNDAVWSTYNLATNPGAYQYGILTGSNATQTDALKTGGSAASTGTVGTVAVATPTILEYYADIANTPDITYVQNGTTIYSGDFASVADTGDPAQTMMIGSLQSAGSNRIHAEIRAWYFLPYALSAAQRLTLRSYLSQVV